MHVCARGRPVCCFCIILGFMVVAECAGCGLVFVVGPLRLRLKPFRNVRQLFNHKFDVDVAFSTKPPLCCFSNQKSNSMSKFGEAHQAPSLGE